MGFNFLWEEAEREWLLVMGELQDCMSNIFVGIEGRGWGVCVCIPR